MRKITLPVLVAIFTIAPVATNAIDDVPPSFDQIIELLDLDPSIKERAMAGEIVTYDREDSMERELAIALVAVIDRPYPEFIEAVRGDRLLQYNQFILDVSRIEGPPDVSKFEGIGYSIEEIGEVRALLEVKPGEQFNLSAEEMEALAELRSNTKGLDDAALIETVNEALRAFLAERLREYQQGGVEAIAPYQRSRNKATSPAEELEAANRAMADMKRTMPNFHNVLENFPGARVQEIEHRFYVFKLSIADRPGFVISHRIYFFGNQFAALAERHIYSPHFYNSLQLVAGVIPEQDKSVVFYGSRTYTDQVAGFASGVKHSAGGKQLAEGITALIEDLRRGVESESAN